MRVLPFWFRKKAGGWLYLRRCLEHATNLSGVIEGSECMTDDDATKNGSAVFSGTGNQSSSKQESGLDEFFLGTCSAVNKIIPYDRMAFSLYAPKQEHSG